jgi:hypothetical protein
MIGNRLLTTSRQDTQDKVILKMQNEELFVFQKTGIAENILIILYIPVKLLLNEQA